MSEAIGVFIRRLSAFHILLVVVEFVLVCFGCFSVLLVLYKPINFRFRSFISAPPKILCFFVYFPSYFRFFDVLSPFLQRSFLSL